MIQSLVLFCILAISACAQNISFFFPGGYDGVDPVATIKTASPSTTQFRVACPSGTNPDDCGWGPGVDYTIISKTRYQAAVTYDTNSMSIGCDYNSQQTQMTCTASMGGGPTYTDPPKTTTLSGSDVFFIQASVVAGASLLKATPTTSSDSGMKTAVSMVAGSSSRAATPTPTSKVPAVKTGAGAKLVEASALWALVAVAVWNLV